jgi:hypothetical protein
VRISFPDASKVVIGFCFECYTGQRYGYFFKHLEMSNRFWRYLGGLKDKYDL